MASVNKVILIGNVGRDPEILLDYLGRRLQPGERVHHIEQFVLTPLLLYEVTDAASLEIGHDHLRWILRIDKATIECRYRQELLVAKGDEYFRSQTISPFRRTLAFLMHRETFGEPPRHAMIRRGQDKYVAHLVP